MKYLAWLFQSMLLLTFATQVSATTLAMAFDADPVSLDPHEQLSEGTLQLSHMAFDPLIRWTQDKQFEARLATRWESIDRVTTRFHLRPDVLFHSGNPFTADDVIFTLKRLKKSSDFRALFDTVAEARKVDELTIDIVTRQPNPLLLNIMTYLFPMDHLFYEGKDEIVKYGNTFASRHVSGTGPFKVVYREPGVRTEFERFQSYWDTNSPGNVDKIEMTPIRTDSTRLAALLSGDVDFIYPVSPIDIPRAQRTPGIKLVTMPSARVLLFQMNQARRPEFRDVRVRKAINLAVNQQIIVDKILKGFGSAAAQLSSTDFMGHLDTLKPEYDLAEAQRLMKEAGYENGFRVSMMAPNNRYVHDEKIAQALAAMLARINIKVELKTLPKAQYFQEYDNRSADIMMIGWQSDTSDSNNFYEFLVACPDPNTGLGAYNAANYCNPKVDGLIRAANREMNPERRIRLLQQIEQTLYDEAVIVPLLWQHLAWGAKANVHIEEVVNSDNFPYLGDLVID